ncbi:toprim domain-containing protein [Adhaeribacter aquaticus]|uniref:toprim domain-containing protein n=1 Tax=Adhaeribacter aquaticus TaxID=299567 RepID=UPI00040B07BC|nr:toprim domain-containing protein [Adhaeribacter aquaticus]
MEQKLIENDPQELERFKQTIDLVGYAQKQGYQLKEQGKRGDWQHLENNGEHIIVSRKDDKQIYFNPGDDRDKGSIIDFVKTRENKSLGEVRQHLRAYLNETPEPQSSVSTTHQNNLSERSLEKSAKSLIEIETEEEKRTRLIAEVLGVKKELSDRHYLHSRSLSDETIDSPAFKGRIFTTEKNEHGFRNTAFPLYNENGLASVEQKNTGFKNLLELPKDGIWVSYPTQGKDTPIERLVVSESAIDSLSYHQLHQDGKNTMYIATAGTVTERQIELIQRVIDKQNPTELILANDRDAGGRKFNINYLNDLQPARAFKEVADQAAYSESSRPIQWHATAGRYHTNLRVEYQHQNSEEGQERIKNMVHQVGRINAGQDEPSIEMKVQRTTEKDTVIKLSVAKADTAQLEIISQELYRQREQLRPEVERHPSNFVRVAYPLAKDFNRDLELTRQGLTTEQIREQVRKDEQERETQRIVKEQQRATLLNQEQAQIRVQPLAPDNRRQEKEMELLNAPAALAGNDPGSEKQVIVKIQEVDKGSGVKGQAEAVKDTLERSGANVGDIKSQVESGLKNSEMKVSYHLNDPKIGKISQAIEAVGSQKGNTVIEHTTDRAKRKDAAQKVELSRPSQQEISR